MLTEPSYTTRDGICLHIFSSVPEDRKALILLVHGLGEHSGRYEKHIKGLNQCGYGCIAFDLRGHGRSDGRRGHVKSYDLLLDDIEEISALAAGTYRNVPLFIYGHSLGGNIVFNYLLKRQPKGVHGAIITSPWIRLRTNPSAFKMALAHFMNLLLPGYSENNKLDPAHLSRDEKIGKAYQADPLVHQKISAGLFMSAFKAGQFIQHHLDMLNIPVLLIHGEADPITSPDASASAANARPDRITYKPFSGMLHETHHEIGKEEVLRTICRWMEDNL